MHQDQDPHQNPSRLILSANQSNSQPEVLSNTSMSSQNTTVPPKDKPVYPKEYHTRKTHHGIGVVRVPSFSRRSRHRPNHTSDSYRSVEPPGRKCTAMQSCRDQENMDETAILLANKRGIRSAPNQVYPDNNSDETQREKPIIQRRTAEFRPLPQRPVDESLERDTLAKQLERTKRRLHESERKFKNFKALCGKDLDDIQTLKEEYQEEVKARRKAEALVENLKSSTLCTQLLSTFDTEKFSELMAKEISCLCKAKGELEKTCAQLRLERDNMISEIECTFIKSQAMSPKQEDITIDFSALEEVYKLRLKSIQSDISHVKESYDNLVVARDGILGEMVMINTKNAELTAMNNELSMRMDRREKEAMALIASTNFLRADSSDNIYQPKIQSRESTYNISNTALGTSSKSKQEHTGSSSTVGTSPESNKLFKFKRTKDAVFGIFGASDSNTKFYPPKMAEEERDHMSSDSSRDFSKGSDGVPSQPQGSSNTTFSIKGHTFKPSKSRRPIRCKVCGDKMWGGTELKCQSSDCNAVCHSKCLLKFARACGNEHASHDLPEENSVQKGSSMFGSSLLRQIQIEGGMIPLLVQACVEAVEERGMRFEGIYRKSGGAAQIRSIQDAFDQEDSPDLCNEDDWDDVCAITSVLKQYFRNLPQPLFTKELHPKFISSIDIQDDKDQLDTVRFLLKELPVENHDTIQYLLLHLDRVQQLSRHNLMTTKNLAVVFGPTLMQNTGEGYSIEDTGIKIQIVHFLLQNVHSLFEPNLRLPSIRQKASRRQGSPLSRSLDRKQL
ncbi:hypothetical protein CLU79DRAFT_740997 [Phycomyces nitens]|nr:hypothetical protein CLU79DRAFT_740997 [Phycomyces nitens]